MITLRKINTPGYKAWEWRIRRVAFRFTRYALGEHKKFGISFHAVLHGEP